MKSEIRISPDFIKLAETNKNIECQNAQHSRDCLTSVNLDEALIILNPCPFLNFEFLSFYIVSSFGFRISKFYSQLPPADMLPREKLAKSS
jgi:hypothetical protein